MDRQDMCGADWAQRVMTLKVEVGENRVVGQVPEGRLTIIPITGGSFEGPDIRGKVCAGGADWNVAISETLGHVLARYWIETEDGAIIAVENEGWLDPREQNAMLRTTPRFQCDVNGPYAHLMRGCYAGELRGLGPNAVEVVVWKLH